MIKQFTPLQISRFKEFFSREGFLILPRFFDDTTIDEIQSVINNVKETRPYDIVIDNLENGDRTVLGLMSAAAVKNDRMKINDLYLKEPVIRALALDTSLVPILRELLGHVPALCNSLYLEKGSSQDPHVDALYMTPRTPHHLIATWVALEDTHANSGELEYFPTSHLIEPMVFSNGGFHFIQNEMSDWETYIGLQIKERGLKKLRFPAKKGDVFIWHSNFLHGGGPINDPALTRKSCVFHYFSEYDSRAGGCQLVPQAEAFWIKRPPPALPHDISAQLPFSEQAYLERYPDISKAVENGQFESGKAHFDLFGKHEGRLPS